ncbi:MAG: GNAT family N-acetyltransferase [Granulosicoccus sp.]
MAASPELSTNTVCLKPFTEHHLSPNYVSWLNDQTTMSFSEQRHRVHTLDTCRQFYQSFANSPHQLWAIEVVSTGEHIGNLTVSHDLNNRLADIGILIGAPSVRGCGYGQTAWMLVLQHLKRNKDIHKITGGCMRCNTAMVRIMESCGMMLECARENHFLVNDTPVDMVYYSTPGHWKPATPRK